MTQEEKQLLLKDLCARLPYGIVLNVPTIDGSENKKLVSIVNEDDGVPCVAVYSTEEKKSDGSLISYTKTIYAICDVLPYLRPMSSMTEEEVKEIRKINWQFCKPENGLIECFVGDADDGYCSVSQMTHIINYLNAHHFDYHGLIEKGLALEAPEGMYKTE